MPSIAPETQKRGRPAEPYRFSRDDYEAMIAAGILDENDRVELIAGEILNKVSIRPSHASVVRRLNRLFSTRVGERCIVSVQDPIALDDFSEPEPDIALLTPRDDPYSEAHPTPADVLLVVEVADSSLTFDRERKIPLYAAAGIPEVWLIDLNDRTLMRFRTPSSSGYAEVRQFRKDAAIAIPTAPEATLHLEEILA